MSLTDELQRLADLKASGALTEAEFQKAKAKVLERDVMAKPPQTENRTDQSLGRAANRYVTFQMIMAVIAILVFLFVIAPRMCNRSSSPFGPQIHLR